MQKIISDLIEWYAFVSLLSLYIFYYNRHDFIIISGFIVISLVEEAKDAAECISCRGVTPYKNGGFLHLTLNYIRWCNPIYVD